MYLDEKQLWVKELAVEAPATMATAREGAMTSRSDLGNDELSGDTTSRIQVLINMAVKRMRGELWSICVREVRK